MIDWLIEHYAEISVYSGIVGLILIVFVVLAHFISNKINNRKSKERGKTDE